MVFHNFFRFISQNPEILPATRCAVFHYSIGARVIRGTALLGPAILSRGLWAHHNLYEKISSKVGPL